MRLFRIVILSLLASSWLPAPLLPGPNLAKRIDSADTIVVAKLIYGTSLASQSRVWSDFTLHVVRVLKGDVIPASDIAAHLEGRGYFIVPTPTQSAITQQLYGIWFLNTAAGPYTVVSRDGQYGELYAAPVILPEGSPAGKTGALPAASVASELVAGIRWIAGTYPAELAPEAQHTGSLAERTVAAQHFSELRTLAEEFSSLDTPITLPEYRQMATEKSPPLRALGIQGLIAANDPQGIRRAAADWSELAVSSDVQPIIASLMSYSNSADPLAVRDLGALALREPAEPGLRESVVYALRAIHTKETLPALVALLDDPRERVRPYALSGLCLFVRNAPAVTPQSIPSMSWLQSRQPTPFLTRQTERFCRLGANVDPNSNLDEAASFWKSWWSDHRAEIEAP